MMFEGSFRGQGSGDQDRRSARTIGDVRDGRRDRDSTGVRAGNDQAICRIFRAKSKRPRSAWKAK